MFAKITPVVLTYNESANIRRTISRLSWASQLVVVDSYSTDETLSILREFPNVRIYQRKFDNHAQQWQFATENTEITTPWILRLDADYVLSDALLTELSLLSDDDKVAAYRIKFDYAVFGKRLGASLYPANTILLRRGCFRVEEHGHGEAWIVDGRVKDLRSKIIHDDRKPLERWVSSQLHYMELEREGLDRHKKVTNLEMWLRKHPPLMPICVFLYCLFRKGMIFRGKEGLHYMLQRTMAEGVLSLLILDRSLRSAEAIEAASDARAEKLRLPRE